jgi:hypothetical protein
MVIRRGLNRRLRRASMGAVRLAALTLVLSSLSSCATLWAFNEVTGSDWSQGEQQRVVPTGPEARRTRVSFEYRPEARVPVTPEPPPPPSAAPVDPAPGVVLIDPSGSPPWASPAPAAPALAEGTLGLTCTTERKYETVRRHRTLYRYDGVWKLWTGFMFIAEATMVGVVTAFIAPRLSRGQPLGASEVFGLVAGGYLALDALGTAILFWHPRQVMVRESNEPGRWELLSSDCPALRVETGETPAAVDAQGHLLPAPRLGRWALNAAVWSPDITFTVSLPDGGQRQLNPSEDERCAWAKLGGVRRDWCLGLRVPQPRPTELEFPRDAPLR